MVSDLVIPSVEQCCIIRSMNIIVQESVRPVGPKDVNVPAEVTACCCVCWTFALVWIGVRHIPRANSDHWHDIGALLHSRVKVVQHEMASEGIFHKIKEIAVSWPDHGRSVLGPRKSDSCWFSSHGVTINAQYYNNLFHSNVHQVIWKKRLMKLSKMIILLHENARRHTENLTEVILTTMDRNHEPSTLQFSLSPHWFSFVWPREGAWQNFKTDNELNCRVLDWVCSQDKNVLCCWHQ
jgi:hypothetical protein